MLESLMISFVVYILFWCIGISIAAKCLDTSWGKTVVGCWKMVSSEFGLNSVATTLTMPVTITICSPYIYLVSKVEGKSFLKLVRDIFG